ncbi:MAG: FtsQ-type POTRA domain-containing protein [Anaerovoracaceae bacterium]
MTKDYYTDEQNQEFSSEEYIETKQDEERTRGGKRRKRKKKRYLLKTLIIILVGLGIFMFLHSSIFSIEKIQATGGERYSSAQIIKKAELKEYNNLFQVPDKKIERRLLEDPYIKEAKVSRGLPHTLKVEIKERIGLGFIPEGDNYVIVDGEGTVLQITEKKPKITLIKGVTVKEATEKEIIEVKETTDLENSLALLSTMKSSNLYFKKVSVYNELVKAYVYDKLWCRGNMGNITKAMKDGALQTVVYQLYKKDVKKGIINIGEDSYCSFSKKIK